MKPSQTTQHIPFYTPIQILDRNPCSHQCSPSPSNENEIISFYIYPCKSAHLSHPSCYKEYCEKRDTSKECEFCVREFRPVVEEKESAPMSKRTKILLLVFGVLALLFIILYVFLWSNY